MKRTYLWLAAAALGFSAAALGTAPLQAQAQTADLLSVATGTTNLYATTTATGWTQNDQGIWYYYNGDGIPVTGEVSIDGQAYLFGADGALCTGWQTVAGVRRYFNPFTAALETGWISYQQAYYYADPESGKLVGAQSGLPALDGTTNANARFLFDDYGALQLGRFTYTDGCHYYADPDTGILATGPVQIDGVWYSYGADGKQKTGWVTLSSGRYYFDATTGDSQMGLLHLDGATYYITADGMQTGYQKVGGIAYYFQEDGTLLQNGTITLDGVTYRADAYGILTQVIEAISQNGQTSIMGTAVATAEQMTAYIRSVNPNVSQSVIDMIPYYLSEGEKEGVRGDIAFAQSCLETGNFGFVGSAVTLDQNNFCGMGVTSNGMKGNSFDTPQLGIRAQIQHLKAYASTEDLVLACIDPRFQYVRRGCAPYVEWLGIQENPQGYGWAAGAGYGAAILRILAAILRM